MTATASEMRSWQEFERSMRNYSWLEGAVPGAMDVDFLIERKGKFLVMEFKPWTNGVNVGFGQHLALRALAEQENFDVFLVGENEKTEALYVVRYDDREPVKKQTRPVWFPPRRFLRFNKESIRIMVAEWYAEASAS